MNGDKTGSERINGILQKRPSLVGYEIDEMAALVVFTGLALRPARVRVGAHRLPMLGVLVP